MTRLLLAFVLVAAALPVGSALAFDADQPGSVALAFLPFEPEREEDAAISFLLEDYVQAHLSRRIRHPVHMGPALQPALMQGAEACAVDADCLMLLGAQFNASLVVRCAVFRSGAELQLETEWFTTGNGVRVGRERVNFEPGDERKMVDALATAFETYFDTSLRVTGANRAGEGGIVDDVSDQDERAAEYRARSEKRVSSRRQDFDDDRDDPGFDRDDPTAGLRAAVGDDDDDDVRSRSERKRTPRRREDRSSVPYGVEDEDEDLDESESRDDDRSSRSDRSSRTERADRPVRTERADRGRKPARDPSGTQDDDYIDLDVEDDGGRSVATYADAQQRGYSRREYERYAGSGKTFSDYDASRWALGKRFGVRLGGVYGIGYLTRRYASTIFIRVGGVKTDEYAWERLGFSAATGGFSLGIVVAPADVFGIEADFSILVAQQDLRREYDSHDQDSNINEVTPEVQPTAHVGIDVTARAYLFPKRRFKLSPGLGLTFLVMAGYNFDATAEGQLEYTPRPTTAVIGLTPVVGVRMAATPFIHIYVDLAGTVYLDQGDTYYEKHLLFGTVEPYLTDDKKQVPLPVIPLMARFGAGVQLMF